VRFKPGSLPRAALLGLLATVSTAAISVAQATPRLVTSTIDDNRTVTLTGNTRPEAKLRNDRGLLDDSRVIEGMQLLLKRAPETQAALDRTVEGLTNRNSPNYHQWLTVEQLGRDYGPAREDIAAVTGWLQAHGFQINGVHPTGMMIDFTGTAGQIRAAFHTEMHSLNVKGTPHIANMSDPRIPAALAPVVAGVVSLHDFMPHTNFKPRTNYTYTSGSTTLQAVVPADLATIYNLNPLFAAGITGKGETVVVIEDTNVYSTADITSFRTTFGLTSYGGTFTQVQPSGTSTCTSPGTVAGAESEAELDAEWAGAAAPGAAIELASCKDTSTTFGGLIALENLISKSGPPAIVSISYGECEAENGATANAAYNTTYQSAAALGVSVMVSAGDEGAASCDADLTNSTHGIGVSGFASTPYNVAVGGTDFGDTYLGTASSYWSTTNGSTYGSALSYIPEIPWNDSCASVLLSTKLGYSTTYGSSGFCSSTTAKSDDYLTTASGSGGPSGCATGTASKTGVVGGTCKGYAKPTWQSLLGNPADGVRDIPDVSLFAANGVWNHYYVYCDSDTRDEGAKCTGAPSGWSGAGGTSFASPIFAGILALVEQKTGAKQGNPNPTLYSLAATEYGTSGSSTCNSSNGASVGSSCIFYDSTLGDMDVNCTGTNNCYLPSGKYGVLSTSDSSYLKAYATGTGWDFATGIGSVNAANLVNNW
jgi:subtilase family serine protease